MHFFSLRFPIADWVIVSSLKGPSWQNETGTISIYYNKPSHLERAFNFTKYYYLHCFISSKKQSCQEERATAWLLSEIDLRNRDRGFLWLPKVTLLASELGWYPKTHKGKGGLNCCLLIRMTQALHYTLEATFISLQRKLQWVGCLSKQFHKRKFEALRDKAVYPNYIPKIRARPKT